MLKTKVVTKPFDRYKNPPRQNLFLMPLIWFLCWILTRNGKLKINKINMKGLKPPFLVFGTHHAFMDFYVTPLALFPYRANYISELEGFENYGEWIYRQAGCLGTRKFINDLGLIKNIKRVVERKDIIVIYPEARYANVGTNCEIPDSVGKLAKMLEVPVVVINMHGNYLQSPIWNTKIRKNVKLETDIIKIFSKEELADATVDEVNQKIREHLCYDEYRWQLDEKIKIDYKKRAEGLELVLYQCKECGTEFFMKAENSTIECQKCGMKWNMNEFGQLEGNNNKIIHIPDWYEWQRKNVTKEIDSGNYYLYEKVKIEALPNAVNFIDLGNGYIQHDKNGFLLKYNEYDGKKSTLSFSPINTFSIHTEYNYRDKKGPCITLSTLDNTYFLFSDKITFNVTKIQFATEYLFKKAKGD